MQHNILFFIDCLNFELTSSKGLWTKVAAMRRKCVVFFKMFVLRSMGNELVPLLLLYVFFVNVYQFVCVLSLLVLRVGCGI